MRIKHIAIIMICFFALTCVYGVFAEDGGSAWNWKGKIYTEADFHVGEFGITEGVSIDKGFFFYNGEYIDAPYGITRKGVAVLINDRIVEPPIKWPRPEIKVDPLLGEIDPEFPSAITEETDRHDKVVTDYRVNKLAYLKKHYPKEEVARRMVEVHKAFPWIESVKISEDNPLELDVIDKNGVKMSVGLGLDYSWRRKPIKFDKESILSRLKFSRECYENTLKRGGSEFFFSRGGKISGPFDIEELTQLVKILRSDIPSEEKCAKLKEMKFSVSDSKVSVMVNNFSASPQLEERLNELRKKIEERKKNQ